MKKKNLILVVLDVMQIIISLITIIIGIYIIQVNKMFSVDFVFYGIMFMSTMLLLIGVSRIKKDFNIIKNYALI